MASNKKITELTELTEIDLSDDDVLPIVDVSAGTTNKVRKSTLASALAGVASMSATSPVAVNQATGAVTVSLNTVPITSGGTGAVTADDARNNLGAALDPTDTRGDLITRGITTLDKLAIGSNNYVLKSNGTDPVWGQVDGGEVTGTVAVVNGGTGASDAGTARTNLGLGSIATQDSSSVSITGGSVTGITDIAIADGGTGASDAGTARTNLGLGTIATQAANNISITGGSITGITDLAVADGGTGASDAAAARSNLGAAASGSNSDITALTGLTTDLSVAQGGTGASDAATARANLGVATQSWSGILLLPDNQSYTLVLNCPFAGTITKTTTKSASGTCTATFKINTTALGGTANSVSSSEQEQSHSSANAFSVGDDIVVTISSNSTCVDASFTIEYTR